MGRAGDMTPPLRWRLGVAGGVVLVVLLFDQLTKLAVRAVGDALHVTVIPGVIDFLFVRNIGAAFSMGEGHGIAFAVLALAVIVAIAVYLIRAPQLAHLEVVGMAMVAGGAIGNAIDRLAFGFVTDFIAKKLQVKIFENGKQVYVSPSVKEIAKYRADQVDSLWDEVKRFENPHTYYVDLSEELWNLRHELLNQLS